MNKKISTIFAAGLLMAGALFSNANAQKAVDLDLTKSDKFDAYYYVGLPAAAGSGSTAYLKVDPVINAENGAVYTSLTFEAALSDQSADDVKNACLFSVSVQKAPDGTPQWFILTSKATGEKVVFNPGDKTAATGLAAIAAGDVKKVVDTYVSSFSISANTVSAATGIDFVPYYGVTGSQLANTNALKLTATTYSVGAVADATKLSFFAETSTELASTKVLSLLNATRGSFSFDKIKDVTTNIFNQTIKAFNISTEIVIDGDYKIPAGVYFATEYSALKGQDIITADQFNSCTFITADPVTNKLDAAAQKEGKGFVLKTMAGKDFNFYTGADAAKMSQGTQTSIYNAIFTVSTNLNNETEGVYKYTLSVKNFRYRAESAKLPHKKIVAAIASTKLEDKSTVLATGDAPFSFVKSDAPIAKPIDLLNDSTASVYNILFTSGEATAEKGKYLSTYSDGSSAFALYAQGTAVATLNAPQYQFVITAVDEDKKKITFTNREAKSSSFTCVLDTTAAEGVYKVVSEDNDTKFTIIDPKVEAAVTPELAGTTIQLISVKADKLAGFANRADNAGYTFITFAKNGNAAEKWYMPAPESKTALTVATATKKEGLAGLWELVKSEKPVLVRQDYMYEKDGVAVTKTLGDTIAYYTYAIKYIDPLMEDYYLNAAGTTVEAADITSAAQFVIKENKDGSVSIIAAPAAPAFLAYGTKALTMGDANVISLGSSVYASVVEAGDIKAFLVSEKLGASLEAINQHVAFEASTGGFISLSAKNEGIVAIKTAASEDLTFWLDTADNKATMPSFFISKGVSTTKAEAATSRLFMYNANDSVGYVTENDPYEWSTGDSKVIFKAATLVNSDTLTTAVNGKTVNVAMEADANGTLAGLSNFKYQIFSSDDADGTYVIRCGKKYLTSTNNQLSLGEKDKALKVLVATQDAPTSNEGTPSVSAVSVIASEGQITIAGAEGKRVAISNILGQVIANQVISSSNATIAAPAGIVVVAVEGEAAVKAIVK